MLTVYASDALGAYGYVEKPWFRPGVRLAALLAELDARGIAAIRRAPPAATDADLKRFHTPAHVAAVTARCATDRGSLDRATDPVNARSRRLLAAIAAAPRADAAGLADTLAALDATLPAFAPFLASEGMITYDGEVAALTPAGAAFLADPGASLGGPTFARAHVERAARHVCGAALDAVGRIAAGEDRVAFVPIAGFHHARRDEARLYCLYNDAALAVDAALRAVDGPVAYVDVDIHPGDGVHEAFADHPRVVLADLHAGDGIPAGEQRRVLGDRHRVVAIGPGHDDDAYLAAWAPLEAHLHAIRPAFVVFVAGVDGLATDPMSTQRLTPAVFGTITRRVRAIADAYAGGRLLVLGGGGYELGGMAAGWTEVAAALV